MIRNMYKVKFENSGTYEDYDSISYFVWATDEINAKNIARSEMEKEYPSCNILCFVELIKDVVCIGWKSTHSYIVTSA